MFTAPDGNSQDHMAKITDKVKTWIARISTGRLPASFNWTSYIYQLWMGVRYGIGALPADREEISGFLQETDRSMLPFLGVNRNIKTGWRTLHRSFLGIGLFNFDVELMIQRVNLFLQHYDSPYDIGVTLRATMELVQLEAGLRDCPLLHSFQKYGVNTTHCWFRSFWQACDLFGFHLSIDYPTIPIPRERDHLLIDLYHQIAAEWGTEAFISWNRCRIACLALFLSDIVTADGRAIDPRYLDGSVMQDPPLSAYEFGQERPCEADWVVWRRFWSEYTFPGYTLYTHLGPWICSSHRPNEWYYNQATDTLFRRTAGGGSFYKRSGNSRSRSQQRFEIVGPTPSIPDLKDFIPVGVTWQEDGLVNLGAAGPQRYDPPPLQHDLFSLLRSWGGYWMWEHLKVFGRLRSLGQLYCLTLPVCVDIKKDRSCCLLLIIAKNNYQQQPKAMMKISKALAIHAMAMFSLQGGHDVGLGLAAAGAVAALEGEDGRVAVSSGVFIYHPLGISSRYYLHSPLFTPLSPALFDSLWYCVARLDLSGVSIFSSPHRSSVFISSMHRLSPSRPTSLLFRAEATRMSVSIPRPKDAMASPKHWGPSPS